MKDLRAVILSYALSSVKGFDLKLKKSGRLFF